MNRASRLFDLCPGIPFPCLDVLFILLLATQAQHVIAQTGGRTPPSSTNGDDEGQPPPSLSPGMSVVLIFFISVFFLTAFVSLYIRQCSGHRYSFPNRGNFFRRTPSTPRQRGLEPAVVNTFPTFLYSQVKGHRIGQRALECAVCLLEFEDDHKLRLLPKCSHVFHPDCIDTWLALRVTCPVCRVNLVPKPGEMITRVTCALCPQDSNSNLTDQLNSPPEGYGMDIGSGSADLIIGIIDDSTTPAHQTPNQNRPPRSTPRKPKNAGNKFHRSNSTGHSIVRLGDHNCERFTLRLPEDVRSQLMKKSPSTSSTATGVFLSVRSPRKGYRSSSVGTSHGKNYERFDSVGRSGGWNFRMTPPFVSQAGWVRSPTDDHLTAAPMNLMRSIKSPLDRLFKGTDKDDDGQRSNRRLIPDDQA